MQNPRNKILIVGPSASGKTTLARKLSKELDLPLFLMDQFMWKPGWEYIGDDETLKILEDISAKDSWVLEGYITKKARSLIFEKADTIIYLDYSRWKLIWQYLSRWYKHRKNPRPELEGSPEKFNFGFLKLIWTKGECITLDKFLSEIKDKEKIIRVKNSKEYLSCIKNTCSI
jgi:adenylate kinase family enzyme